MSQPGFDWSADVNIPRPSAGGRTRSGLPWSGRTAISRHHSAQAAQAAAETRVTKTLQFLDLLEKAGARGLTDHEAQQAMGVPLSSICSIRNNCGGLVEPNPDEPGVSPYGRAVTRWRRRGGSTCAVAR